MGGIRVTNDSPIIPYCPQMLGDIEHNFDMVNYVW